MKIGVFLRFPYKKNTVWDDPLMRGDLLHRGQGLDSGTNENSREPLIKTAPQTPKIFGASAPKKLN